MSSVFISYRRDDSFTEARLLMQELERQLPETRFFLDESAIQGGDDWRATLHKELERAQIVLVVIGRQWVSVTDDRGARRLDDPDDVVRWEVSEALASGKRIIPVLVDGAAPLRAEELPQPLQRLAALHYREIGRANYAGDVHALAKDLSPGADPVRWNWLLRRSLLAVPVVAAIMLLLVRSHLFERVDVFFQNRITWLGDALFDMPLHPELRIVALPVDEAALRQDPTVRKASNRERFADLLDALTAQGARAVVFDVTLSENTRSDSQLAASIRAALAAGVRVVIGFKEFAPVTGRPLVTPLIDETGVDLGVVCVGDRGRDNVVFATFALLDEQEQAYHSLPLLAVHGPVTISGLSPGASEIQVPGKGRPVPISLTQTFDEPAPLCPARSAGTSMVRFIPHLSNRQMLRRAPFRHALDDVLEPGAAPVFSQTTVLVGVEDPEDMFETPLDLAERRYGFEFQADAINALLSDRIVTPIRPWALGASVLGMAALAAGLRLSRIAFGRRRIRWIPWLVSAGYLGLAVVAYRALDSLWQPVFPIAALATTWTALSILDRRGSHGIR